MGQKVHPTGIRLGIVEEHRSQWFATSKNFAKFLGASAFVSKITIKRLANTAEVILCSARPGVAIGKKGEDIEKLKIGAAKIMGVPVTIQIEEIRKPELDAELVASSIAQQLERRVMYRRAMKRAVQNAIRQGAQGIKISVGGRLGGAEIARSETVREGRVPLHTFRANIDYAQARALTQYGIIGVKVWIFKGEVMDKNLDKHKDTTASASKAEQQ
jgi:small subunit ribosomal protein S3